MTLFLAFQHYFFRVLFIYIDFSALQVHCFYYFHPRSHFNPHRHQYKSQSASLPLITSINAFFCNVTLKLLEKAAIWLSILKDLFRPTFTSWSVGQSFEKSVEQS